MNYVCISHAFQESGSNFLTEIMMLSKSIYDFGFYRTLTLESVFKFKRSCLKLEKLPYFYCG